MPYFPRIISSLGHIFWPKKSSGPPTFLTNLPDDILYEILSNFDNLNEILGLIRANKQFYEKWKKIRFRLARLEQRIIISNICYFPFILENKIHVIYETGKGVIYVEDFGPKTYDLIRCISEILQIEIQNKQNIIFCKISFVEEKIILNMNNGLYIEDELLSSINEKVKNIIESYKPYQFMFIRAQKTTKKLTWTRVSPA